MKGKKSDAQTDRRGFLKLAGTGVVGGGAVAAASVVPAVAAAPEPEKTDGYQETEHVRRYYELAKFM
ncbi:MAG: formate dehydrogenase [Alphaproteobacteria bacterium]|nr:formate dehydrogenase [Alphaproteobacteria bacterium]